jgi:hypothetical protein
MHDDLFELGRLSDGDGQEILEVTGNVEEGVEWFRL